MPKTNYRRLLLEKRRTMTADAWKAASLLAQQTLIESLEFERARVLALYASIQNELDTSLVMETALAAGKIVLYPAMTADGLLFRRVTGKGDFLPGLFGVLEPVPSTAIYPPTEADLIVIPGVAFDTAGNRIGYGKGYYDKALHQLEGKGRLTGFCHDFQLVDEIVGEPHDVKMDRIITERRVIGPLPGLNI